MINVFSSSVFAVYTPFLFRKFHEAKPEDLYLITIKIINVFSYITILFMFFSQELLNFFATEEYNSALNVMFPVTLSSFFIVLYGFFAAVQFYHTKKVFIIMTSIFVAGLNILLNSITIPKFGFVSAGYTTLISYVFYAFMHFIYTSRILNKNYYNKKIFNYSGIFLITLRTTIISFIFIFFDLGIYKYLFLLTTILYLVIFRVIRYNKVNSKK